MKKFFTLLAFVLCSLSMSAQKSDFTNGESIYLTTTYVDEASSGESAWITKNTTSTKEIKPLIDPATDEAYSGDKIKVYQVKQESSRYLIFKVKGISKFIAYAHNGGSDDRTLKATVGTETATDLCKLSSGVSGSGSVELDASSSYEIKIWASGDLALYAIKVEVPSSDDPAMSVSKSNITMMATKGVPTKTEKFTVSGRQLTANSTVSISCDDTNLQVSPTSLTVDEYGSVNEEITVTYAPTANTANTTASIAVKAGNITKTVSVAYSSIVVSSTLASISEDNTWDFTTLQGSIMFGEEDIPMEYVYTDLSSVITIPSGFNANALSFKGTYPIRDSKYAQDGVLKFNTTVPGTVTVYFSNTGSNNNNRFVTVTNANETQTGTVEAVGTTQKNESFDVIAGEVQIGGTGSLRYMKIEFIEKAAPTSVPVTIAACGYGTLVSEQALDFESNNYGVTAYIATGMSNGKVQTQEVTKVPANTGIILKGTEGTFEIPVLSGDADDVSDNKMMGSATTATTLTANQGYILYTDGKFHPCNAGELPAGKAYLNIEASSSKVLDIDFEDPTAISAVESEQQTGAVYTLPGVRVSNAAQKGVYIVNGKKVVK